MASAEFSDSDASFEVDQILNQRKRKGVLEYMVRWKGFGKSEDSWEPAKNLKNCAAALAEYTKLIAAPKTPKKTSSRSKSRSRSRSRSRTTKTKSSRSRTPRARSRTPRARTPKAEARTPRSRSRSSSRGRTTKTVKESPSRQSRRTEVITKSSTNREPGRIEKKTEVFRQTTDESKPTEVQTTRVVRSRVEVKTVEDKVDGKLVSRQSESSLTDKLQTIWQSADMAALILFICVSVIVLSYVVENQYSLSDMWKAVVGMFTCIVGSITAFFQMIASASGRMMESAANFTRQSWKKITN